MAAGKSSWVGAGVSEESVGIPDMLVACVAGGETAAWNRRLQPLKQAPAGKRGVLSVQPRLSQRQNLARDIPLHRVQD